MPQAVTKISNHAASVFSGATLASVLWFGQTVVELDKQQALLIYRVDVLEQRAGQEIETPTHLTRLEQTL